MKSQKKQDTWKQALSPCRIIQKPQLTFYSGSGKQTSMPVAGTKAMSSNSFSSSSGIPPLSIGENTR